MGVLTETEIRRRLTKDRAHAIKEIYINKEDILTPSAKSYLGEKNIKVKYVGEIEQSISLTKPQEVSNNMVNERKQSEHQYMTIFGIGLDEKPEHMTHLRGATLVFKDHPRIVFRGKIDSLEAKILEVQLLALKNNMPLLVEDLQEIIRFIRKLLRCEVSGEPVGEIVLQGLNENELREQSYHPSQYFGIKHFLPDYKMGEVMVALNSLRTQTRETEIIAYQAFSDQYRQVTREDIIQSFNRLSSLFWIMMFKVKTDRYK